MVDVVVVGAGVAGLTVARLLHAEGLSVRVVEARSRIGGRILTVAPEGTDDGGWIDLGATWLWDDQPQVRALAAELGLATFAQFSDGRGLLEETQGAPPAPVDVPAPSPAELRFVGGAQTLCQSLADRLPPGSVSLGTAVSAVADDDHGSAVTLTTDRDGATSELTAEFAVLALPPRLAMEHITFSPALPEELVRVVTATPTWMGNAVKCVAVYEAPFWREAGWSGFAYSHVGPLREVYDGCTDDGSVAALWGFVSADDAYREIGPGQRAELIFDQLSRLFGRQAGDPVQYVERDWSSDPNTNDEVWWVEGDLLDYGHPAFAQPLLGGRLVWAGAETVAEGGGHMEGAVRSARRAAHLVLDAAARR